MEPKKRYVWALGYWSLDIGPKTYHFWNESQVDRIIRKLKSK